MKLKYFSEQTMPRNMGGGKSCIPRVNFGNKGAVAFNKEAGKLLGFKVGDKISLGQDEEDPENWYFFLDKDNGFAVRQYKDGAWLFNHAALVSAFVESKGFDAGKTIKALIAGQPTIMKGDKAQTKYWGILVRPSI
ncbi:MAG TPA: hypothetical protein VGN00_14105 [Puia sp.]|jgi:hypothetical protein